jgi:hypothetical protein
MELMAMLPALIGTAGGAMNMINGAPANRVQPGMNPLQFAGSTFQPAVSQGYGQLAGMPNIYADTLGRFGDTVNSLYNNPGASTMIGGTQGAAGMGAGAANNTYGLGNFLAQMGQNLTPWAGNMLTAGSTQNPNTGGMMTGAQTASGMGMDAARNFADTGRGMQGVGGTLLNAGFDPQHQLYDRTQHQLQEQTRASQAARGF